VARRVLSFAAVLLVLGCESPAPDVITPEDLRGVFVRRSVCQGVALSGALVNVLGSADDLEAAASVELACGRDAETCEAFLACSDVDASAPCDPATTPFSCDGATQVSCDLSGYTRAVDCDGRDGNTTCLTDESSIVRCALEACAEPTELACVDGYIETCTAGVRYRADDCGSVGRDCVTDGTRAACVDRAEACERDACDGDTLLQCVTSGLGYVETACSERIGGGRCALVAGEAQCVVDEAECTGTSATCAGSVLRACVGGRFLEVDCATFLDARCEEDGSGNYGCVSDAWTPG
jgi:hypothetical protein